MTTYRFSSVESALLIFVVLTVVATVVVQVRSRRQPPAEQPAPLPAPAEARARDVDAKTAGELAFLARDEVLVLPPADEHSSAVVLGRTDSLAILERAGLLAPLAERRPFQQLIDRVEGERRDGERRRLQELADEPLEGGYLKLSEESRRQLADGKPVIAKTGEMLGQVNNKQTKRRHHLRFTDYKTAADPNLIRSAATLKAMAAMQEQLEASRGAAHPGPEDTGPSLSRARLRPTLADPHREGHARGDSA